MQDFERELRERLSRGISEETIRWIKDRVYQSYRNGLALNRAAGDDGDRVRSITERH